MRYDIKDVECPYCDHEQDIDHDDGYGYAENETFFQECEECGKTFSFTTSVHYYHDAAECPCKNGEDHNWEEIHGCPDWYFLNKRRCSYCQEEKDLKPTDEGYRQPKERDE